MIYRLNRGWLFDTFGEWNRFLRRMVHLIACGGTAMTLLGVKPSTKDVDLMVPELREYAYLTKQLSAMGYKKTTAYGWKREGEPFQFDIFSGKRIHTTELMESPLEKGRHSILKEFSQLYIGVLNDYDLISSKLMRGTRVDFEDCVNLALAHRNEIDLDRLFNHFHEMVSFDVAEDRLRPNIDYFLALLKKERRHGR